MGENGLFSLDFRTYRSSLMAMGAMIPLAGAMLGSYCSRWFLRDLWRVMMIEGRDWEESLCFPPATCTATYRAKSAKRR
jgi:hypothetical protein